VRLASALSRDSWAKTDNLPIFPGKSPVSGVTVTGERPDVRGHSRGVSGKGGRPEGGWLGRQDSNLGMVDSKSTAPPLGAIGLVVA
jgi:hypothetical protein